MTSKKRSEELTQVVEWNDGSVRRVEDCLAGEEPLEIRIGRRPLSVTMRTPGHDAELAAGFVFAEGIVESAEQIASIAEIPGAQNAVRVVLARGAGSHLSRARRNFAANSACGVCGKASIDQVRARAKKLPAEGFRISAGVLCSLPDRAKSEQAVFGRTGGLHAAALFTAEGKLIVLREDIGRHNAVDKVIGWAVLQRRLPLSNCAVLASGRGGFEIVQKAVVAGIPVVACVSAPSSLAVQLARRSGQTLVGFLRGKRFVIYSGEERVLAAS
ncbi:MAG TPA: formate dehydrogenase accessory sulfurtransferase FdhD [Candidatus Acidoferrales bacterium]|nr:formate dehydrogenase accessory sulfurtransferase FdhD [Candidatus Acidoferrales bacterium]